MLFDLAWWKNALGDSEIRLLLSVQGIRSITERL